MFQAHPLYLALVVAYVVLAPRASPGQLISTEASLSASEGGFTIDGDFPGGNIAITRIDDRGAFLSPDLRDTQAGGWWFYWSLRLRGPVEEPIRVHFTERNPIGVKGPAYSIDAGRTWRWLGAEAVRAESIDGQSAWSFSAEITAGAEEAIFAFCPSYLQRDLESWLKQHESDAALRVEELCRSRRGRKVELLRSGCLAPGQSRGTVLLTSRHHCCEAMATYVLEGFLEAVLAHDSVGRRWRHTYEVLAVPFMDKDGVEDGDQGKNRSPHDHNRDYNETPLYPEVASLMKLGKGMKDEVVAAIDLHCPNIRGAWSDRVYLVGSEDETTWKNQKAFGRVLERVREGRIPFSSQACLLPYGTAWNTAGNVVQGKPSSAWARETFPEARLVTPIEVAYAEAQGVEVNPSSARALGRDLARALLEHLEAANQQPAN